MSGRVAYETRGPAAWITLERPEKLNALTKEMVAELVGALDRADADDEVKVVVLTGAGRAFSAGYDLAEVATGGAYAWRKVLGRDVDLAMRLEPSQANDRSGSWLVPWWRLRAGDGLRPRHRC